MTWAQLLLQIVSLINKLLSFFRIQKAKQEGREEVVSKVNKATEKLKNEFEKIDNSGLTTESAISGLRNRANRNAGASRTDTKNS